MTSLGPLLENPLLRELSRRGHEVPRSVEHLLNAAHEDGVKVKLMFPESGHPDAEAKDCFTLVYGVPPHFTCKPNLRSLRKALASYNQQAKQQISLTLSPREMEALQKFGAKIRKNGHVIHNDGGDLHVRGPTEGHVLAVPQLGKGKVPRSVLRKVIGMHDADAARDRAKEHLSEYQSGEITPFLGTKSEDMEYHFDEETMRHNPLVRFYNGKDYAVMMHYGDAFRIIQGMHPAQANLVDFFPAEAPKKSQSEPLFVSKFRMKAFAADLKAHNGRAKSNIQINVTEEQMAELRKRGTELETGNYVLRHQNGMLHVYEKPN